MTANHKIDRHTKKGPRAQRAHKEEATFDAELQEIRHAKRTSCQHAQAGQG